MKLVLLLFYLFAVLKWADAQRSDITPRSLDSGHNHCAIYKTCSKCIQQEGCAWCSQKDFFHEGQALDRCNPTDWFQEKNNHLWLVSCTQFENISAPTINMLQDDPLGDQGVGYQMRPQRIAIKTGPHKPANFQVQFRRVEGYPVDLYYIMDLSTSMKVSKDKLVNLAASLADTMRKITTDFQMGFGSFIDKPMSPFVNENLKPKPYLFKHHMKLSRDTTHFKTNVNDAMTYDNLDSPEGGLEALMQTVVCTKQIGWRSNSHRLVIFSTDAPYHLAGDGKLAGILSPNDESCHVTEDGKGGFQYEHFNRHDYPSIAQISRQIANNSVNVIFAVNQSIASTYRQLSARISGSYVGELTNDASNIVAIIQDQYNKISSSVRPSHRAPEGVDVSYTTSCSSNGIKSVYNRCDGITKGSTVTFNVTISVTKCRNQSEFKEVVEFFPVGVNEVVKIELDVSCQCPCEQTADTKSKTTGTECNSAGKYRCGNCECNQGYWGSSCECIIGALSNPNAKGCKPRGLSNSNTSIDCSGRGNCICEAKCNCRSPAGRKVWGDYCQCDDFACPISPINQQVCSGQLQGDCPCNGDKCECKPGWEGNSCECPVSKDSCSPTGIPEDAPCSGRGTCKCGKCDCNRDSFGDYCEFLPCKELMSCVQCKAFQSGPLSEEECKKCAFDVEKLDKIAATKEGELVCSLPDNDNCNILFIGNRLKLESIIRVLKTKECSEPPNIFAIVGGVSGAILAIGLFLLLLWKILTTIHDRLEYAKFLRDRDLAKWDRGDNPIYKRPTTIFANPAYSKDN